jgi:hypothetical protein
MRAYGSEVSVLETGGAVTIHPPESAGELVATVGDPTRIAQLMEEGPFRQFAFLFIDRSVKGELYVGDKPNLRSILQYAQNGINNLLERALQRFFPKPA